MATETEWRLWTYTLRAAELPPRPDCQQHQWTPEYQDSDDEGNECICRICIDCGRIERKG